MHTHFEHSRIIHPVLIEAVAASEALQAYFTPDFGGVRSKHFCGLLHVKNETHYILPKIARSDRQNLQTFIYMLAYTYDLPLEQIDAASSSAEALSLLEALIAFFAKRLLAELQRGVAHEYRAQEENLRVVRGRIMTLQDRCTNFARERVFCAYDEFTPDTPLNRFLRFAATTLMRFTCKPQSLRQIEAILDEVEAVRFDLNRAESIRFDRLNRRFEPSYQMALMLLRRLLPLFEQGERSFAFLFDMNALFERFVGKMITQIRPDARLHVERNFGNLKLRPDIVLDDWIIDTKYKRIGSREEISTADKYQMFTYGKNFKIAQTMLLYPKHLLHVKDELMLGNEEGVRLSVRSLDLDFEGGYKEYIDKIKKRLEEDNGL